MANFRFLRLTATSSFNGVAPLTTDYVPENNGKQPTVSVTQATIGRLSFAKLLRPGSVGGLFRARTWGIAAFTMSLQSMSADENAELATPDNPVPASVNTTLKNISLTSEWSPTYMAGPSDALRLISGDGDPGTIEIAFADATGEELLAFWSAEAAREPVAPIHTMTVTTDTTLTAWDGDLYIIFEPATAGVVLTLPLASTMAMPARLHLGHTGGSWGSVAANAADEINGATDLNIGERKSMVIELLDGDWIATDPAIIADLVVTNGVAGDTQTLPVIYGPRIVSISYTEYGNLKLPPIAGVPIGAPYVLQRTGDSAASPPVPAQCKVIVDSGTETLDGVSNGVCYLGPPGSTMIVTRAAGGWVTVGNRQGMADQVILVTGTSYDFLSGWVGTKYLRSTAAGAVAIGCPPAARTPIGCRLATAGSGAGGITFSADANFIEAGVSAGTLAAVQLVPKVVEFNGTNWVST